MENYKNESDENFSDDDFENFKFELEKEFFELEENGEDNRYFLYFPKDCLTDSIRDALDARLINESYENLGFSTDNVDIDNFIVFKDGEYVISLDKNDLKIEHLNKMLIFYSDREEFEKCIKITNILKLLTDNGTESTGSINER